MRRLPVDEYLVLHITAAADQLLEHLAAIEGTALPDQGIIAVLTRAGGAAARERDRAGWERRSRGRKLLARLDQPGLSRPRAGRCGGGMTLAGEDAVP